MIRTLYRHQLENDDRKRAISNGNQAEWSPMRSLYWWLTKSEDCQGGTGLFSVSSSNRTIAFDDTQSCWLRRESLFSFQCWVLTDRSNLTTRNLVNNQSLKLYKNSRKKQQQNFKPVNDLWFISVQKKTEKNAFLKVLRIYKQWSLFSAKTFYL